MTKSQQISLDTRIAAKLLPHVGYLGVLVRNGVVAATTIKPRNNRNQAFADAVGLYAVAR
jgi:hypothetical protein